jgi:crossover junction endodeoxyribonuclease RusA
MTALTVFVSGKPAPQGSKRHVGNGVLVESSKAVKPWRQDVREGCLVDGQPRVHFPQGVGVVVTLTFVMPRPSGLPKTKPTPAHTKRPDVDKLTRAVFDAIGSAGVWHDDSQVVDTKQRKRYAAIGETPGCHIFIHTEQEQL